MRQNLFFQYTERFQDYFLQYQQHQMKEIVGNVAKQVDINERLGNAPQELSGGQKQRVSLAGVMVDEVKILLFDEPLANLDPKTGKSTIELIDDIQRKTNTTVVIIEHRLEDVLWKHVDRIIMVDNGGIVCDLKPNNLLSSDILAQHGIREPLYLTACKYAGVDIVSNKNPENINDLKLDSKDIKIINNWFASTDKSRKENTNSEILKLDDIHFSYDTGDEILHGISFSIKKGEMVAIVGENGAGKSTTAKLICGFEKCNNKIQLVRSCV